MILPKHHWNLYIYKEPMSQKLFKKKEIFKNNQIESFWDIGANVDMYPVLIAKNYSCNINSFERYKNIIDF